MPSQSAEALSTQWAFQECYPQKGKLLPSSVMSKYTQALLDVAGADGSLADAERKWVLGFAAAQGLSKDEIDHLKNYKLRSEDSTAVFNSDSKSKLAEHFRADLIYNGLRAAAADGTLKQSEIDAIAALAKQFGITDEKFQDILGIYREEEEERQRRIAALFPHSYGEVIKAIDKHYAQY